MEILKNQPLASHTTMKLGGNAKYMVEVANEDEIIQSVQFSKDNNINIMVLGGGSNIIFGDAGYNGLVIINRITGIHLEPNSGFVTCKAGVDWDEFVKATVDNNLCGIEALSLIPGTVGAAPVNNIGAYGQEVKDTISYVRALDTLNQMFVELSTEECHFGYRNSLFKTEEYGRYIITEVAFKLKIADSTYVAPRYGSLQTAMQNQGMDTPTVQNVREAVITIRSEKLPDPTILPNTGSFFKNPVVTKDVCESLLTKYPSMPYFQHESGFKLAAGWLIDAAGLKGYAKDGIRVYDKQALVLVNDGTRSFQALENMKNHIQQTIYETFGIQLEPEPEIIA